MIDLLESEGNGNIFISKEVKRWPLKLDWTSRLQTVGN